MNSSKTLKKESEGEKEREGKGVVSFAWPKELLAFALPHALIGFI